MDILKAICKLGVSTTKGIRAIHIIGEVFEVYLDDNKKRCTPKLIWEKIQKMASDVNPMIELRRIDGISEDFPPLNFDCSLTL